MVTQGVRRLQCLVGQIPVMDSFDLNGHRRERLAKPGPAVEFIFGQKRKHDRILKTAPLPAALKQRLNPV